VRLTGPHEVRTCIQQTLRRHTTTTRPFLRAWYRQWPRRSSSINSGLSRLELCDVTLARAEEEDAQEIVLRLPRSEKLKSELIEEARRHDELHAENTADSKLVVKNDAGDISLLQK
jgi:hypothetical protein